MHTVLECLCERADTRVCLYACGAYMCFSCFGIGHGVFRYVPLRLWNGCVWCVRLCGSRGCG